jgi:hypothetical protein
MSKEIAVACTSLKRLPVHSTSHSPGFPLRIFFNSTFHFGKPTPGKPFFCSLGKELIFHRLTQALVVAFVEGVKINVGS